MNVPATSEFIGNAASWAAATSLAAAPAALLLLLLGRITRFPFQVRWLMGAALLLRLLLPAVPELPGLDWLPAHTAAPSRPAMTASAEPQTISASRHAASLPASTTPAIAHPAIFKPRALAGLWLLGVAAVGAWIVASHLRIQRRIARNSLACEDERLLLHLHEAADRLGLRSVPALRILPGLDSPALAGPIRPCVLIPEGFGARFNDEEVRGVFLHELAHVKRHDLAWSWLALAACALHWFNPLAWLAARRFRADRELACDRLAARALGPARRHHLGEALLKTLEGPRSRISPALASFALRQPEIRQRILMIAQPLTTSVWTRTLSALVAPAFLALVLSHAAADGEKSPATPREGDAGAAKTGARDGGKAREGARDGAGAKTGPRDGEGAKSGQRDGEGTVKNRGARDGEGTRRAGAREGEGTRKASGEGAAKKTAVAAAADGKTIVLRVTEKGAIVIVDGEKVPVGQLRARLSEFLPAHAGQPVVIETDADVSHETALGVLDAARDNGAKKATLASPK